MLTQQQIYPYRVLRAYLVPPASPLHVHKISESHAPRIMNEKEIERMSNMIMLGINNY